MKITDILSEGPNDPNIFKAIFLAGGPGSGKSYVSGKLLKGTGMRVVNSDDVYEYMMTKAGMALDPENIFSPAGQETRKKAKKITKRKQEIHIDGRLGMIIDGTGKDVEKYAKMKQRLEDLGYDTMMLFVNTSLDVAQERNLQRPRSLDPKVVKKMWDAVQQNIMSFQQLFGAKDFYVIDNSGGLEDPSRQSNFSKVQKAIDRFINTPPRRPAARQWLAAQKPGGATPNRELPVESVTKRTTIGTMKGAIITPPGNTVGFNVFEIPPAERGKLNGTTVYHQTRKLDKVLQSGGLRPRADASGEREFALTTIQSGRDWRTPKGIFVSTRSGEWFGDEISFKIQPSDKIYRAYTKTGHLLITNPVSADRFINAGPIKNGRIKKN